MIKPFRMRELLSRIRALLRRVEGASETFELLREGEIVLDEHALSHIRWGGDQPDAN